MVVGDKMDIMSIYEFMLVLIICFENDNIVFWICIICMNFIELFLKLLMVVN